MILKKFNAITALSAAILLALHSAINAGMMLLGRVTESPVWLAVILLALFFIHMLVSLFILIFSHDGSKVKYTNISKGWLLQRISALAMIPLVLFHSFVHVGPFGERLIAVLAVHFFVMLLAYIHIPLSVPNALVTLGIIDTTKQHKTSSAICWIVCALLFLLGLTASLSEVIAL